jgi:tight adherence protein C
MSTFLLIGLGLVVVGGVTLLTVRLVRARQSGSVEERLDTFATMDQPPTLEEIELSQPFTQRVLVPVAEGLARLARRFTPQERTEAMRHKLELAGSPYGWTAAQYLGLRVLAAILCGGLGVVIVVVSSVSLMKRMLLMGGLAVGGYYLPAFWLASRMSRRQRDVIRSLPDALDLLTICVEAGLGFDGAMARVADKWNNELSREFARVLQEIQLGKLRRKALRSMADRIDVPEVSTFVAAIVQAEELGVSIAKVLSIQAEEMRRRRRQRAEELARQAPIKMLPAIAFLIFPAIFVVLLGPAVIRVMTMEMSFGGLGGGGGLP